MVCPWLERGWNGAFRCCYRIATSQCIPPCGVTVHILATILQPVLLSSRPSCPHNPDPVPGASTADLDPRMHRHHPFNLQTDHSSDSLSRSVDQSHGGPVRATLQLLLVGPLLCHSIPSKGEMYPSLPFECCLVYRLHSSWNICMKTVRKLLENFRS